MQELFIWLINSQEVGDSVHLKNTV